MDPGELAEGPAQRVVPTADRLDEQLGGHDVVDHVVDQSGIRVVRVRRFRRGSRSRGRIFRARVAEVASGEDGDPSEGTRQRRTPGGAQGRGRGHGADPIQRLRPGHLPRP